ncbi:citrate lyase acyl carrier protein [candidate division WOR-3 bacterium JGI_Cruoil_03_51_56]|uniref:Citrate lyase acyl carrier protein n=1 Tax=candidate division WOR-3 bacterium JGI_Cruoil_03_51_56 TaxID=1973747 RepID=A0A235BUG3_UNCW3|nr:MAG: citrate lyase acyl carrier protein [candidate division WOR-3 bacterium JGI_Cruoil_03_51_56]
MNSQGIAGHKGRQARSDCWVSIEPTDSGGIKLDIKSKVDFLYKDSIHALVRKGLDRLGVSNAKVCVEDQGALPFVIMARLETAARRALPNNKLPEYLPETKPHKSTTRDRWRRSRLYLPGNEPKYMLNAKIHKPDGIILDLEDSVPPEEKDAALTLVRNALIALDFGSCERMVRINQIPAGLEEIGPIVKAGTQVILIPKCETAGQVKKAAVRIKEIQNDSENDNNVFLMPIIESPLGMFHALEIAQASSLVVALTYGLEDYTAELGARKTGSATECLWARSQIVNAARAAGVQPIDTVFADAGDTEGLKQNAIQAREMGFEGKGCIHPRQIPIVNLAFTPTSQEIEHAQKIVLAYEKALKQGRSVVSIGSKMIDLPVVHQAQRIINLAMAGKLSRNLEERTE